MLVSGSIELQLIHGLRTILTMLKKDVHFQRCKQVSVFSGAEFSGKNHEKSDPQTKRAETRALKAEALLFFLLEFPAFVLGKVKLKASKLFLMYIPKPQNFNISLQKNCKKLTIDPA